MSEWNVIHENFHTKHSVLTAPDEHMPYIIQLHIMSIRWAYYEQMKQQNIWSVHVASIRKENRSKAYLIKNSKGEGGGKTKKQKTGVGLVGRHSEGLGRVVWVYKIGLKWPVIAMAIARKPQSLSLRQRTGTRALKLYFTRIVV